MELTNAIGKLILFKFDEAIKNDFKIFELPSENVWCVLSGVEPNMGVWVENPKYESGIWWNKDGKTIPEGDRKKENFKTDIFIPWRYIKGIMCVKDKRFNKDTLGKMPIGFVVSDKK